MASFPIPAWELWPKHSATSSVFGDVLSDHSARLWSNSVRWRMFYDARHVYLRLHYKHFLKLFCHNSIIRQSGLPCSNVHPFEWKWRMAF